MYSMTFSNLTTHDLFLSFLFQVWNPWPWTELLDKIASHYELEKTAHFLSVFDEIDIDKGGTILRMHASQLVVQCS